MPDEPAVRKPRQARSQETLDRLLDATEELLKERPLEDISVAELVRTAGTSVGAFYNRFRDKDALLPALYERYDAWITRRAQRLTAARPWEGQDLVGTVHWVVREIEALYRHRRHFLRAVTLHARTRPEKIDTEARSRRVRQMSFLREAILEHRPVIVHSDPERAVDIAIFTAATLCRETILFGDSPHASSTRLTRAELMTELAQMLLGYLTPKDP